MGPVTLAATAAVVLRLPDSRSEDAFLVNERKGFPSSRGDRGDVVVRSAAAVLVVVTLILCLVALTMGFHIEGTDEAIDEAQQGQRVAIAAVPGLLFACLALVRRRRRALLALVAAGFALVAALLALA